MSIVLAPFERAQKALAQLRIAIHDALMDNRGEGLTNAQIGRCLGIYMGHKGHQGHVSRTLLSMMEAEGSVYQDPVSKKWCLAFDHTKDEKEEK